MTALGELRSAIEAGRGDAVDDLLNGGFFRYLLTAPAELRELLSRLPDEWYRTYPRHRMTRAIAEADGPMQLVDDAAARAFAAWVAEQTAPDTRDLLAIEVGRLRTMLATGSHPAAAQQATRIREMIGAARDTAGFHDVLPSVLLRIGVAHLEVGDLAAATEAFATGHRWASAATPHPFDAHVRGHLALGDALHDDFPAARTWLQGAAEDVRAEDGTLAARLRT